VAPAVEPSFQRQSPEFKPQFPPPTWPAHTHTHKIHEIKTSDQSMTWPHIYKCNVETKEHSLSSNDSVILRYQNPGGLLLLFVLIRFSLHWKSKYYFGQVSLTV
jgi:hypothetical protein